MDIVLKEIFYGRIDSTCVSKFIHLSKKGTRHLLRDSYLQASKMDFYVEPFHVRNFVVYFLSFTRNTQRLLQRLVACASFNRIICILCSAKNKKKKKYVHI